ncbi:hypothetical protein AB0H49_24940 [Nocardia sp. NPDC050713]|uniref:hypothetical protein n=1 Tax=Nocardia sp. NPDC050713 TaxID=3154511 RepID=UPI0033D06F02
MPDGRPTQPAPTSLEKAVTEGGATLSDLADARALIWAGGPGEFPEELPGTRRVGASCSRRASSTGSPEV